VATLFIPGDLFKVPPIVWRALEQFGAGLVFYIKAALRRGILRLHLWHIRCLVEPKFLGAQTSLR
jgi:hypothetical protein